MSEQNNSSGSGFNLTFGDGDGGNASIAAIARQPNFAAPNSGDDDGHGNRYDPDRHSGRRNRDGSWSLKRGRRGTGDSNSGTSRTKNKSKAVPQASIDALTQVLIVVHAGLAGMTKAPELELEKDDAETLSKAAANVMSEFDVTPDPKVTAIVGLVMAAGTVYGPKMYMIRERIKEEREAKKEAAANPTLRAVN